METDGSCPGRNILGIFFHVDWTEKRERNLTELFNISNWALTVYETGVRIEENIPDNKTANKISAKNSNFCNV